MDEVSLVSSDGETFHAPKTQLEEHSDFFKALFNSGMRECQENRINLPTLSSEAITLALEFIQKNELPGTLECVSKVLEASTYLQMSRLTDFCSQTLMQQLECENCFRIYQLAQEFLLPDVARSALNFMSSNFDEVSQNEEFTELQIETLIELLQSRLCVEKEINVFNAAVHWLTKSDGIDNVNTIDSVFDCIRFPLMDDTELDKCSEKLTSLSIDSHSKAFTDISIAKECVQNPRLILKKDLGEKAVPRRMSPYVVAIGGFTKSNSSTSRLMITTTESLFDVEQDELVWSYHPPTRGCPRLPRPLCEQSVVAVGVFVFVAGGQTQYCQDGRHTSQDVYCLDTRTYTWTTLSSMKNPRSLFYLGAVGDDYLYAVGGWVRPDTVSRSTERYDMVADRWEQMAMLDVGLHEHAGAVLRGDVYVSGGFKGPYRGHLDRVWRYDPTLDMWEERASMTASRSYHCMVSTGDKLLVAGGVNYVGNELFEDVKPCELYDPDVDQWTTLGAIPRYASCMSYLVSNNRVFIFGGHSFEEDADHNYVQIYDFVKKEWTEKLMKNNPVIHFACVLTEVPDVIASRFTV